jgi:hypothetical protein
LAEKPDTEKSAGRIAKKARQLGADEKEGTPSRYCVKVSLFFASIIYISLK